MKSMSKRCKRTRNIVERCLLISWLITGFMLYVDNVCATETECFPIPVSIDNSYYVKSSIYIRCSFEEYDIPLIQFIDINNSQVSKSFKEVAFALRDQNLPGFMKVSGKKTLGIQPDFKNTDQERKLLNAYRKLLSYNNASFDFVRIRVIKQFLIGDDQLVLWGVDPTLKDPQKPLRRIFKFKKEQGDCLVWDPSPPDEIGCLINDMMQQATENPVLVTPLNNVKSDFEFAIPGTNSGYPVYLQFDGKVCDFNILGDATNDEILAFYQKCYRLFVQSPALMSDYYTVKSAHKYRQWINDSEPNLIAWHQKDIVNRGRKILFVLNADPVFIIFYQPVVDAKMDLEDVRYEYIVREPKDNQLRLTNLGYIGYLSQYFDNRDLFINPFLRPILRKNAVIK